MSKQYAFFFDSESCAGCKACQVACKDKNDLETGILWRRVYEVSGGGWFLERDVWKNNLITYNISLSCNHCEKPLCVNACPAKALRKRKDGIVYIEENKCIGCRYCEWACPYDAPQYNSDKGVMTKCDFCFDYIDNNVKPACVSACPMRVIDFGELEELRSKHGSINSVYPLPEGGLTMPSLVINPHREAEKADKNNSVINNTEEV